MNARTFRKNVILVVAIYGSFSATMLLLRLSGEDAPADALKDVLPMVIAIPAAWLSYCLQRRQAYHKSVHELWSKIVVAVQEAIQYTHIVSPTQADYARAQRAMSIVIDEVRAIFRNIGESGSRVGLFPFEELKGIQRKVGALRPEAELSDEDRGSIRKQIVDDWKVIRESYLKELQRDMPIDPQSPFLIKE